MYSEKAELAKTDAAVENNRIEAIESVTIANGTQANKVNITIVPKDGVVSEEEFLAYDVVRCTISEGIVEETPIAHVDTYNPETITDTIETMNNRTIFYRVRMIDQHLNRSKAFESEMTKTYLARRDIRISKHL